MRRVLLGGRLPVSKAPREGRRACAPRGGRRRGSRCWRRRRSRSHPCCWCRDRKSPRHSPPDGSGNPKSLPSAGRPKGPSPGEARSRRTRTAGSRRSHLVPFTVLQTNAPNHVFNAQRARLAPIRQGLEGLGEPADRPLLCNRTVRSVPILASLLLYFLRRVDCSCLCRRVGQ